MLPGAQVLGGEHRGAVAAANGNHDEHIGQGIGGTHCRQCVLPHKVTHDHGIRHIVKLLEQVAQNHGKCKHQETFARIAPCQVNLFFQLMP